MVAQIVKYFPDLTDNQISQFERMGALYTEWNAKINLVSRKDIDEIYTRHILHSLAIAKVIVFQPGASVLDVGTGGGFPGIPLATLFPDVSFHLVDSIGKKIKVVNQVAEELGLKNVKGTIARAEGLTDKYDFVVSRAVTRLKPFYGWVKGKFNKELIHDVKNGIFYLKGGDLKEELSESKLRYKLFNLPDYFEEEFFETKKVVYVPVQ
ncbi:16S rRNA (guanine(527)-N(7))-methyltransferase RsmG [Reichenbachiella sp. MALMAid0571]|uniref:16S rRNA (guanine(527)-N(7))-methyltransferase RsmG n=1 Tax=Reichenbachiella sp. MALMAid0571 TaxID=3143939 RepID=UPI0032DEA867